MTHVRGLPPGRAGRPWLARRLESSRRGADVLDRKLRILRHEHDRYRRRADEAAHRWAEVLADAEVWALRAALLAGDAALEAQAAPEAVVDVEWSAVMGTRFPRSASLRPAAPVAARPLGISSAVTCAGRAYRDALAAAVDAAAAVGAARVIEDEIAATRMRLRAIQRHWIPQLEQALTELELALSETENSEAVRLRLAGAGTGADAGTAPGGVGAL